MKGSTSAANGGIQETKSEQNEWSITIKEFSQLLSSQPTKWNYGSRSTHQIHRVPQQLRLKAQRGERVFDPMMVSFGPYHHGTPELRKAEGFKSLCLDWCASCSKEKKVLFYNKIYKKIGEIRGCYAEVSIVDKYDDKKLALMMLLDACFILNFMANSTGLRTPNNIAEWHNCFGTDTARTYSTRDIMLLENQIPFHVLKMLIGLCCQKEEGEKLLPKFFTSMATVMGVAKIPREVEEPPPHLLGAFWRVMVEQQNINENRNDQHKNMSTLRYHTCRSVTYLKAKGIYFTPGSSYSFKDIKFKSRTFSGQLQLPVRYVSEQTQVVLSNLIAYEVSPGVNTGLAVVSYVNFMKSLIESPADVKELQERGVLFNRFANHEQAVKVFQEIDTVGLVNFGIFIDVKSRIDEHCRSKAKTWVAELILTRFQNPWTITGLLAATFLLILTLLQTYFTIHPR